MDELGPDNVTPLRRRPARKPGLAPVTPLPVEAGQPLQGDEEWLWTLPDPHDTTVRDEQRQRAAPREPRPDEQEGCRRSVRCQQTARV